MPAATAAATMTTTMNGTRSAKSAAGDDHRGNPGVDDDRGPCRERLHGDERGEQRDGEQVRDARGPLGRSRNAGGTR